MNLHDPLSNALLADIERLVDAECRVIEETGRRDAATIVEEAYAATRARVRDAVRQMRRERARQLRQTEAQMSTRQRMSEEARTSEMLRRACPQLAEIVVRRWQASDSRRAWIEAAARAARQRLLPGPWTVEHPAAFDAEECAQFIAALAGNADHVSFEPSAEIAAGLRVRTAGALLDATPEALLGDRQHIESMLLATLASDDGRAARNSADGSET